MLEYVTTVEGNAYKLGFVDENSPKEWASVINNKLSEYKEFAYIDSKVKINKIIIILELNPLKNKSGNSEYLKNEKKKFENYYEQIIKDIGSYKLHDLMIPKLNLLKTLKKA